MAVGPLVKHKFVWLLPEAEIIGRGTAVGGDDFDVAPDPSYWHLINYFRGNQPLPWATDDQPSVLHLEAYPLGGSDATLNHDASWDLPKKPEDQPFEVVLRDGTHRALAVGDHVRVTGQWVIDHHPEHCDKFSGRRCRYRGL